MPQKINHSYVQHVAETAEVELDRVVVHIRRARTLLGEVDVTPNEISHPYFKASRAYRTASDLATEADALELRLPSIERDRTVAPEAAASNGPGSHSNHFREEGSRMEISSSPQDHRTWENYRASAEFHAQDTNSAAWNMVKALLRLRSALDIPADYPKHFIPEVDCGDLSFDFAWPNHLRMLSSRCASELEELYGKRSPEQAA